MQDNFLNEFRVPTPDDPILNNTTDGHRSSPEI